MFQALLIVVTAHLIIMVKQLFQEVFLQHQAYQAWHKTLVHPLDREQCLLQRKQGLLVMKFL